MAIPAESTGGTPFAKFVRLGDKLVGALGSDPGKSKRQQRDFDTKEPKVKPDGKPLFEEVAHFVAMPGTTAQKGDVQNDKGEPIEEGEHVAYAFQGFKWGQAIEARNALPAYAGFKAGQVCSGDVYTIELIGWSAETENPQGAINAGFTVVDGRVVLRTQEDKDRYILAQSRRNAKTTPANDFAITCRRPTPDEKRWEQEADALWLSKPWDRQAATVGGGPVGEPMQDEEPFTTLGDRHGGSYRNMDVLG